jgi:hypothetical protein
LIQNFSFSPGVLVIMGLYQILLTVWNNQKSCNRERSSSVGGKCSDFFLKVDLKRTKIVMWY